MVESVMPFERLLAKFFVLFSRESEEPLDRRINEGLELIARHFDAGTATLVEMRGQGLEDVPNVFGWAMPGIPPVSEVHIKMLMGSWFHQRLLAGESIILNTLPDDLPPGADIEREMVKFRGLKSNLTVHISATEYQVQCALDLSVLDVPRTWDRETIERVQLAGEIFANAIYRKRAEETLRTNLQEIQELEERLQAENLFLREEIRDRWEADEIVGESPAWRETLSLLGQVAPMDLPVLLLGETGTGKELLARAIHDQSPRRAGPFIAINCASIPESLQESELFGHEKGAFTGAVATKPGRLELADGGTLFLDEVGDMALQLQSKLLRALQFQEIQHIGGTKSRKVDVRLVAATNSDLSKAMQEGTFRQDFYYRLSAFSVRVPPLRERVEDIPLLVWYFINRHQSRMGRHVERVQRRGMDVLMAYPWPGNVRELENVVERALVLSPGDTLQLDHAFALNLGHRPTAPEPKRLDGVERDHIRKVLERHGWRINGPGNAAEVLGLNPSTLRFRMKKLGIERPGR
jgi:formate hydrogenlyase transcriptional activator